MPSEQDILLAILKTWDIKPKPEFRGFRCANCQEYMESAWHHFLHSGGFVTPIHFCDGCEEGFKAGMLKIPAKEGSLPREDPGFSYAGRALEIMKGIAAGWTFTVEKKQFSCDLCFHAFRDLRAWHVWIDMGEKMVEEHFCNTCWSRMRNIFLSETPGRLI